MTWLARHRTPALATTALTVAVAAIPVLAASGATPRPGAIHLYEVGTLSAPAHSIVITGVFADAGTFAPPSAAGQIKLHLSKGTIKVDDSRGASKEQTIFANIAKHLNTSTCGFSFSYSAPAKLLSGTQAYAGIKGTVTINTRDAGVFPKNANGTCNSNANPLGYVDTGIGSGTVSST